MAVVIRTLFNNQRWCGPCRLPGKDARCSLCFEDGRVLRPPQLDDETCSGLCWERDICSHHEWPCTPKGNTWGDRVQPGDQAFFVYREPAGGYTVWGYSHVFSVEHHPRTCGDEAHEGYAFLRVDDFDPILIENRLRGLSAEQLVGAAWGQGAYRYLSHAEAERIEKMLEDSHGIG
ncbi:MAG: hypothetical protein JXA58_03645 [Dehalococcoidia bacterium]|nr:hypothetical protein [Dehalococcoidia bacterium]